MHPSHKILFLLGYAQLFSVEHQLLFWNSVEYTNKPFCIRFVSLPLDILVKLNYQVLGSSEACLHLRDNARACLHLRDNARVCLHLSDPLVKDSAKACPRLRDSVRACPHLRGSAQVFLHLLQKIEMASLNQIIIHIFK